MDVAIVLVAAIAFLAFRQWLQLKRRTLVHQERLAAIEKGIELPPVDQEVRQSSWSVQRFLLLGGLIWISIGAAAIITLSALIAHPMSATEKVPEGIQWIGVGPLGIGLSHLIVYLIGRGKEK